MLKYIDSTDRIPTRYIIKLKSIYNLKPLKESLYALKNAN